MIVYTGLTGERVEGFTLQVGDQILLLRESETGTLWVDPLPVGKKVMAVPRVGNRGGVEITVEPVAGKRRVG